MTELLTAAQMRAIETAAIAQGRVTGLALMERAGQGVVAAIFAQWPDLAPAVGAKRGPAPSADASPPEYFRQDDEGEQRAVVLCGPGNNGGDGFVVARLLKEAGWEVDVFLYGDAEKLPPDARENYAQWAALGEVMPLSAYDVQAQAYALGVDALFGTGLTRPLEATVVEKLCDLCTLDRTVAIDIISGFCADSGRFLCEGMPPGVGVSLCVTFHVRKIGHSLADCPLAIAKLRTVDIGLDRRDALRKLGFLSSADEAREANRAVVVRMSDRDDMPTAQLHGQRTIDKAQGHKYSHGHAYVLSGGVGKGGAARLAARGALRVGAGAVTVGVPPAALVENAAQLNAVMLKMIGQASDLSAVLRDARINALCIGPSFGTSSREVRLLAAAIDADRPLVLDADALTILAEHPDLFVQLHPKCVLTPHAGEFGRLFPEMAEKLSATATQGPAYSKVDATREAAKLSGCVVLFKGPDTVIAAPGGRCCINASFQDRAAPWLATAGSGDVLAGFITGLLARGYAPLEAAEYGAWLHTECAVDFGPGLIAEDLPEILPRVLADICSNK
ncbi:yjeF C-terminal region, hydroxyethylthiazole kinase-related/yjeF N-terminal region [Cognatiyoonia koreensis]|uniref:Bifunctional NAD(P)H-hydrate repair enzyme n=1 Tax=Cognatiyoonia koreensis TaxID=364200 RepID=A0A1I0NQQ6_9RHOB|nr:NAD(P)H-hydrate dehydratase [Cognatiyoonia koreensis]SEW03792.1 yjeF C-terminal region, hydroxyethylthiazole kinase-related/yjeF N-terminal region [Cognatiyoonia koreensis]